MALLHSDGFDSHATGAAVLADGNPTFGAQAGVTIDATAGRFGGKSLSLAASTTGSVLTTVGGPGVVGAIAGWFKVGAITAPLTLIADGIGPLVTLNVDRSLTVKDGAGVTKSTSSVGALPVDTYVWLEVFLNNAQTQTIVNGVQVGGFVGSSTLWANTGVIKLLDALAAANHGRVDVDDFIIWNSSGSFFNSFSLAPRRIQLLQTDANGAAVGWTPVSGTNWAAVNSADWTGGVGVNATNIGTKDRYSFTNLAATPGAVDAVTLRVKAISTGSDPATLALLMGQGVTEVTATPQTVPTSAGVLQTTFYRDTANVAWTESSINAAEFGQVLGA